MEKVKKIFINTALPAIASFCIGRGAGLLALGDKGGILIIILGLLLLFLAYQKKFLRW